MKRLGHYFNKLEEFLSVGILMFMLAILTYQIILRFIFRNSNAWTEELARYLFVWFVFLTASMAILKKAHIRVDALLGLYPKPSRKFVILLGYALFFVYCLLITYYSYLFCRRIYLSEQISLGLEIPMVLVVGSLPVCHVLMALRVLQRMYAILFAGESAEATVDAEVMVAESMEKGDGK